MTVHSAVAPEAQPATRVNPVTAAVIHGALENIAIEMGHKLMRMAYSSIIRESEDFGAALTDPEGGQLCECKMSTPLQSGPIPGYVRGIRKELARRGESIGPGDVIMHNDPYGGASHGPDVAFCVPVFLDGQLVGFSVTTAHHLDIGASTPGSAGIVSAVDAYAEGLQFKAIKIIEDGRPNRAVWQLLRDNIRASDLVVGDMEAQIKAAEIGADRFLALVRQYGLETLMLAYQDLMDYSERLMRNAIRALPDGDYAAETTIDGFLDDEEAKRRDLKIKATLKVRGDEMTVDLTGTAPQVDDRPINMPLEGTVDCAIWLTLRSILLDSAVYGNVPQNMGLTRPIRIVAPKGTLANPNFPAPVIARFCPGNALADTVMKALAQCVPGQVSAGIGNLRCVAFTGLYEGRHWVQMEILEGSYGGREGLDGMDAVDTLYANTRNNPIEDIELHLPLRVNRYELRDQAPAKGKWRGGIGSIREFAFLADGAFSVEGEGHKYRPWGFAGGADGSTASLSLIPATGRESALPSKVPYRGANCGDRLKAVGPNGGGYGDPFERDPEAVLSDVLDGYISTEQAEVGLRRRHPGQGRGPGRDRCASGERDGAEIAQGRPPLRAIIIEAPGAKHNLTVGEAPQPIPGPGEALIDVAYCGCNFADTMIVSGTYPHPKGYPIVGGLEVSGRIAALGAGVSGPKVGDRVAAFLEEAGGFADQCVAPVERLIPIPPGMALDVAAAFPIQALTAWHLLHNVSVTRPGDVILIHAVGGGVGLFATQLAVRAGADRHRNRGHEGQGGARAELWRGQGRQPGGRGFR